MSVKVDVYQDESGVRPFEDWFDELPAAYAAKVAKAVVRLSSGSRSGLNQWAKVSPNGE
jgi:hypothetical protein